jgi:hypothetical protein
MAGGPTAQTRFKAWPQALIGITNSAAKEGTDMKRGLLALFMISDTNDEWASWYYYNSEYVADIQILGQFASEILAVKSKPSHFMTYEPMRVNELCGASIELKNAALHHRKMGDDQDHIEFLLFIRSAPAGAPGNAIGPRPTTRPIHLRFRRKADMDDISAYPAEFGYVTPTGIEEKFNFLWPYRSSSEKLKAIEDMLLHGSIRLGPSPYIGGGDAPLFKHPS